jgi:hypothetical protein
MRTLRFVCLLFAVLIMASCATVQVSQDYEDTADLFQYDTWQWRDPIQVATGDIRVDNPLLDKRIRRAVENHLAERQLDLVSENPDFYLAYYLTIEQKILSDTYYSSVGVGSYYHPWYGGLGGETRIRQYEESRLTIDFYAVDSGELRWRGVGTFRMRNHKTPDAAGEAMRQVVDKILYQFPPGGQQ